MASFISDPMKYGFRLLHREKVEEIHSEAFQLEHIASGARLLYLQNEDENKVFSISFRTPPKDNTGVFHILEHSVLCGSKKYPVKEPFVELLKGSLNTFLNAFTFSDKTMYPVASINEKDFHHLIDVYMDAVLHPNIYKYEEIMQQEGWHYELSDPEEALHYKGVVYNEMKGALSSPESLLMRMNQNSLYPNTPYGFESGGDPQAIPDLTYSQFLSCHRKYYSPSNSYIYLYGSMDIGKKLQLLDSYLSGYSKTETASQIVIQPELGTKKEIVREYPILPDEKEEDKTYLSLNFSLGKATDPQVYLAFDILNYLLLESSAAPLKKALLDSGIGQDVFGIFDNSVQQPYFSIAAKNANEAQKEQFRQVVFSTLKQLVQEGISKKLIEAAINVKEFQLREADYGSMPKGLIYSMTVMDSWLYDGDPLIHLKFEKTLATIKQALTGDYFEKLIKNYLLNSNHQTLVIIKPSRELATAESEALQKKLDRFKRGLNQQQLQAIVASTRKLKERQERPDAPEDLRKIPLLQLKDIEKKSEQLPLSKTKFADIPTLYHDLPTNKIAYLNLYFDASSVPARLIPYLGLLQELLGRIETAHYDADALANEINIQTGDIHFENNAMADKDSEDRYRPRFTLRAKILQQKMAEAFDLVHEILHTSKFSDRKRIRALLQETKSRLEMSFNQNGNSVALRRLSAYYSRASAYREQLSGLSFYRFISDLDSAFDEKFTDLRTNLETLINQLFAKEQLVIGFTGDQDLFAAAQKQFNRLQLVNRPPSENEQQELPVLSRLNEGLITSSKVQYAAKGADFKKLGFNYTGHMLVLKQILTLDYLWNKVRVMGGAYGCGISVFSSGNFVFWSYRDPNLSETLQIYDRSSRFVRDYQTDDFTLTKYIIGTIAALDSPLSPSAKGALADERYFSKVSQDDLQRIRDEVLTTRVEDIRQLADLLQKVTDQNLICVLGNEDKIKQNQQLFGQCVPVFH